MCVCPAGWQMSASCRSNNCRLPDLCTQSQHTCAAVWVPTAHAAVCWSHSDGPCSAPACQHHRGLMHNSLRVFAVTTPPWKPERGSSKGNKTHRSTNRCPRQWKRVTAGSRVGRNVGRRLFLRQPHARAQATRLPSVPGDAICRLCSAVPGLSRSPSLPGPCLVVPAAHSRAEPSRTKRPDKICLGLHNGNSRSTRPRPTSLRPKLCFEMHVAAALSSFS